MLARLKRASQTRLLRNKVTAEEIAEVVGKWTGIPVARLLSQEKERLLHLEQALGEKVIGQSEPISRRESGGPSCSRRVI
jgi:ATP-dependent Clp protease ATP-binding subunit ClpB